MNILDFSQAQQVNSNYYYIRLLILPFLFFKTIWTSKDVGKLQLCRLVVEDIFFFSKSSDITKCYI